MSEINAPHLTIFFDPVDDARDGRGWNLDTSDSNITERFATFLELTMYASRYTRWLMGDVRQGQS